MSLRAIELFKEISEIPRCSRNCEHISSWLCGWAEKKGFDCKRDKAYNVLIEVPATSNKFKKETSIAIQGHMDMVCVNDGRTEHRFSYDPIDIIEKDGWLMANGTTLGADDGVALAIGLAIAEDISVEHPKLELLFTADEEIGLIGAKALEDNFIRSRKLINIDSEEEGVIIVGCAGGEDSDIELDIRRTKSMFSKAYKVSVYGLKGGHSGIDINKKRANAIKLMVRILKIVYNWVHLVGINGGKMRNAIPDHCEALICVDDKMVGKLYDVIRNIEVKFSDEFALEGGLKIKLKQVREDLYPMEKDYFEKVVGLLNDLPHGVYKMFDADVPEISSNLAAVKTRDGSIRISVNQRSLTEDGLDEITSNIRSISDKYGGTFKAFNRYPPWTPDRASKLLLQAKKTYLEMFDLEPKVEVIHAGLECGIIGSKVEGIDMISIGPTIENAHTPSERLNIESFERIYRFVCNLISL